MGLQLPTDAFDLPLPAPRPAWWNLPPDEWLNSLSHLLCHRVRYAHGIWHLLVLGGTFSHFVTVLRFV